MSENSAKVREKAKVRERSENLCSRGNLILAAVTYLHFIRTVIHFSYAMFTEKNKINYVCENVETKINV